MNAIRPPTRRPASSPPTSSAWSESSTRSSLTSYRPAELSYLPFDESSLASFPDLRSSSGSGALSDDSIPDRWAPLYADSTNHSSTDTPPPTGSGVSGQKKGVAPHIPSDVLPRLQVLLKNQLLEFLDMVDYDDMSLETMLHTHSFLLARRNQDILKLVCHEGQNCASAESHLRYFKYMYRMLRRSQFSGVGGRLWGLWKLETIVGDAYKDPHEHTTVDDDYEEDYQTSESSASSYYGSSAPSGDDDGGDDEDHDDDDGGDDGGDDDDDNDSDQYGDSDDTDMGDDEDEARSNSSKGSPDRGLVDLLNLLREFALNRYILSSYKSILTHSLVVEDDEISNLLNPKKFHSTTAMKALRQQEAYVLAFMQSLTFLYKLQLLVQFELENPEDYWRKDFEHPAYDDQPLSLLWSKSMMTMMMTHFHREESDSERYWKRHGFRGVSRDRIYEEWKFKLMYLSNYLRFAEATVNDWFSDPEIRHFMAQERAEEIDQICSEFSEMRGRLKMLPCSKMYREDNKVSEWIAGIGEDLVHPKVIVGEVEAKALAGVTFKIGTLREISIEEAVELITRHGGTILTDPNSKADITVGAELYCRRHVNLYENNLPGYIRSKIVVAKFAHTDKNAVKNMIFSFRGILPTLTRTDAKDLVESHGGFPDGSLVPEIDYVVVGTPNPSFELETWDRDMKRIDELGLRKIDEEGFIGLLEKSQSWLRNGKRKAPDGSSMGEIIKRIKWTDPSTSGEDSDW